jgi:hypothetical protein
MEPNGEKNNTHDEKNSPIKKESKVVHHGGYGHHHESTTETNDERRNETKNNQESFFKRWRKDKATEQMIAFFYRLDLYFDYTTAYSQSLSS